MAGQRRENQIRPIHMEHQRGPSLKNAAIAKRYGGKTDVAWFRKDGFDMRPIILGWC
jgi:hypothetical protein